MEISGQYYAIQNVAKGDLVQLVYGQEGFVMRVYEKSKFLYTVNDTNVLQGIGMNGTSLFVLSETLHGNLRIYRVDNNVVVWTQAVNGANFSHLDFVVGNDGVYLYMVGDSVITLPNGISIQDTHLKVLVKFSLSGTLMGFSNIKGPYEVKMAYDFQINEMVMYGNSTEPLYMNNTLVIDRHILYGFIIGLGSTLSPLKIIESLGTIIVRLAAGNGSIAFTNVTDALTYMHFINNLGEDWSVILGNVTVRNIEIFANFIGVVAQDDYTPTNWILYQYAFTQQKILEAPLPVQGIPIHTAFAAGPNRFLLYIIANNMGGAILTEYNVFDDVVAWSIPIPVDPLYVAGDISSVSVAYTNSVLVFGKRLPAVIGVVAEIYQRGTGPTCGTGFVYTPGLTGCVNPGPTGYTGPTGCVSCPGPTPCPTCIVPYVLPNGLRPQSVKVEFVLTTALAPVIPGQEYFINSQGNATQSDINTRYIGTALDSTRVLLLSTITPI